jgi:hypothetical protein
MRSFTLSALALIERAALLMNGPLGFSRRL